MRYLHEQLTSLREGVAGSSIKPVQWLKNKIAEVICIAATDDPEIVAELLRIQEELRQLKPFNCWRRRVKIDCELCEILNKQVEQMRKEERKWR